MQQDRDLRVVVRAKIKVRVRIGMG
jgi:hypothetical protein